MDAVRVRRWSQALGFGVATLALGACRGSFDIHPTNVPQLHVGTVRDLSGELQEVPERWEGEVLPRKPPGKLTVGNPARREITEQKVVRFESPLEAGVAPFGAGLEASRGNPPSMPAGPRTAPSLWLRDADSQIVEIPLDTIARVRIKAQGEGLGPGGTAAIVIGCIVGAGAFAAGIYALSTALDSYQMN